MSVSVTTAYKKPLNLIPSADQPQSFRCAVKFPSSTYELDVWPLVVFGTGEEDHELTRVGDTVIIELMEGVDYGDAAEFTVDFELKIPSELQSSFESGRVRMAKMCLSYVLDGEETGRIEIPNVRMLNHIYNPAIAVFGLERGTNGEISDDGETLLTTLKIDYSDGDMSYMPLRLHYAEGVSVDETAPYIDLSGNIAALKTGVVDDPDIITQTFSNGRYWAFLLVFGDEYEKRTVTATISRAFANLHLSGWPTGGACFGGFGKSQNGMPMLESYFRFYPYAGIDGVNIYKSTEVRTGGLWSDNKPIYRKVLEVPEIPANRTSTNVLIMIDENMETLIEMRGMLRRGTNAWWPLTYRSMSNYTSLALDVWSKEGGIAIRTGSNTEISGGYIVVDYTKTTDEA